jgi:hypothetical protein
MMPKMNVPLRTTLQKAIHACTQVAKRINADEELRKAMLVSAKASPENALTCYRAIQNSYKRRK